MEEYIGIITATIEEFEAIKDIMKQAEEIKYYDLTFCTGKINIKNIILVKCGVGKVNAARTTQILTDKFNVKSIINVGSAGGLNNNLEIGDIVIAKELVQHDFDITPFGHEKGYITDTGKFFKCDEKLINIFKNVKIEGIKITTGIIASGDIFCADVYMKEKIRDKFNADCCEMEGAAIAQVCYLNKIPFLVIRAISDIPNGKNHIDFDKFIKLASKNCAKIIKNVLTKNGN